MTGYLLTLLMLAVSAVSVDAQSLSLRSPLKRQAKNTPKPPEPPLIPLVAPAPAVPATAGSIFVPAGHIADASRDFRASEVNDLITIVVNENASAVASGVTNTARKSAASANIAQLAGKLGPATALANLANLGGNQTMQGTGQTSRNVTLTTTLSARVIGVSANGTMLIEGTKDIAVNAERQTITVRGLVRPEDLTTTNTIASTRVTNLQIQVNGKGVVGDAVKRPNILYRALLGILPF